MARKSASPWWPALPVGLLAVGAGLWWLADRSAPPGDPGRPSSAPAATAPASAASRPATQAADDPLATMRKQLGELLDRVDQELLAQSKADIRTWLDHRLRQQIGGILPDARHVKYRGKVAYVEMSHGAAAEMAAQFLRAFEILSDKRHLDAALGTCEFLLKAQQARGYWVLRYATTREGKVTVLSSRRICRLQNGMQFRPFALLLLAHRLTGKAKYRNAALRCAEGVLSLQDPETGAWPAQWQFPSSSSASQPATQPATRPAGEASGGACLAGLATTDGMRMMVMAYQETGDRKYLQGLERLGRWIADSQLGEGKVRGWAGEYDPAGRPRKLVLLDGTHHAVIEPRIFLRHVGPMLEWLCGLTGQEKYLDLIRGPRDWLRSVERDEGWAELYLTDGTPLAVREGKAWRLDDPKAPKGLVAASHRRDWAGLERMDQLLSVLILSEKPVLPLLAISDPIVVGHRLTIRLRAAQRATDLQRLAQIRKRWMRQDAPSLPSRDPLGRAGVERQAWVPISLWQGPYRPLPGQAQWQFVYDVAVARGEIRTEQVAGLAFALPIPMQKEPWDVVGDWTQRAAARRPWSGPPLAPELGPPASHPAIRPTTTGAKK
jgi:hypothetical protein